MILSSSHKAGCQPDSYICIHAHRSSQHIKVTICKPLLLRLNSHLHNKKIRSQILCLCSDGIRLFSIVPWGSRVFGGYEEITQTLWFVIPQWRNTLIKPSAHGIPVVFCSWMLSLEELILAIRSFPRTRCVCAGWRAIAIHFSFICDRWLISWSYCSHSRNEFRKPSALFHKLICVIYVVLMFFDPILWYLLVKVLFYEKHIHTKSSV